MSKSNKAKKFTQAKSESGEQIEVIGEKSTLNATNVDPDGYYEPIGSSRKEAHEVVELWPTAITLQGREGGLIMEPYWNFVPVLDLTGYKIIKRKQDFRDER